jgi:hypothetical protein
MFSSIFILLSLFGHTKKNLFPTAKEILKEFGAKSYTVYEERFALIQGNARMLSYIQI